MTEDQKLSVCAGVGCDGTRKPPIYNLCDLRVDPRPSANGRLRGGEAFGVAATTRWGGYDAALIARGGAICARALRSVAGRSCDSTRR